MFVVFIDETGNEDFSYPKFPIFGRGACAVVSADYKATIEKPWRKLKRDNLGGANKPFHAVDFCQLHPNKRQIYAINDFLKGRFYRFFQMISSTAHIPTGIDGHQPISWMLQGQIATFARKLDIDRVALVFESSHRGNPLVERDFILEKINMVNMHGQKVEVDGYFLDKKSMNSGLEVADLIVHTAGRQARKSCNNNVPSTFNPDYQEAFHSIELGLANGTFINSVRVDQP